MTERTDWTKTPGPHSATSYADSKTTIVFALPTLPPLPFLPLYWVQPHVIGSQPHKARHSGFGKSKKEGVGLSRLKFSLNIRFELYFTSFIFLSVK